MASAGLPAIVASGVLAAALIGDCVAFAGPAPTHTHGASAHGASTAGVSVQVVNAWIPQPPPGADVAAVYFTLRNSGADTAVLVGVDCPAATDAMVHESSVVGGESRMRMVDRLTIAAGGSVTLKPRGLHVMLDGLKRMLEVGERVPLVLHFADGKDLHVSAQVRPLGSQ